jgi:hypothetical protein
MVVRLGSRALVVASLIVMWSAAAHADDRDPCDDGLTDPVITPVRPNAIDAQRGACLRDELGAFLHTDALIDPPGFRGVIGGELRILGRMRIGAHLELDAGVRAIRYMFVQNAVTKVSGLSLGPVTVGGAWGGELGRGARVALAGTLELPFTRDDLATLHTSGEVSGVVTAARTARTTLHARLGGVWMYASSMGGATGRGALRAGADLARRLGRAFSLHAGADVQAGWYRGLDHVNVRGGVTTRLGARWRSMAGLGFPVGGEERMTAIFELGIIRELH